MPPPIPRPRRAPPSLAEKLVATAGSYRLLRDELEHDGLLINDPVVQSAMLGCALTMAMASDTSDLSPFLPLISTPDEEPGPDEPMN